MVMGTAAVLASAQAFAGSVPTESVPMVSELGMLGMSVILAGFAARFIAKRVKKT
jgi:hypothetical protein